uniref:Hexosyltransferase n=1 Tax=Alexandrium monilatum TaxID=311494 RepID=A0A7S4SSB4_9DINO
MRESEGRRQAAHLRWVAYAGLVATLVVCLARPRFEQFLRLRSQTLPPLPSLGGDGPQGLNPATPTPEPSAGAHALQGISPEPPAPGLPQGLGPAPPAQGPSVAGAGAQGLSPAPPVPGQVADVARTPASGAAAPAGAAAPWPQLITPTRETGIYTNITAHSDLVTLFFDEASRVYGSDLVALHKTMSVQKPFRAVSPSGDGRFDLVNRHFDAVYQRTYHFAERFIWLGKQRPGIFTPKKVKLLILTLTMSHQIGVREVHRRTWMSRPGVCWVNASTFREPKKKGCRVFATFAPGWANNDERLDELVAREGRKNGDITRVDAGDPDATGKVDNKNLRVKEKDLAMLLYATTHWPWITHIGKNDLDNYPEVDLILADLDDPEGRKLGASRGVPPEGWLEDPSRPVYYGALMGAPPKLTVQIHGGFMQGQFYAITRHLAACVMGHLISRNSPRDYVYLTRSPPPLCGNWGEGDIVWGCIVRYYAGLHRNCSVPWWINMRDSGRWHLCKP